jgi:FKBP-type peptidyl-prolyl cis-trans isomerase FkpA
MIPFTRLFATASFAGVLAISGCLSVDSADYATVEGATFASSLGVDLTKSTRTPNGAYTRDIVVGTGATVAGGQLLNVKYTVWLADGTLIETNENTTTLFPFHLGQHEVLTGWDEGIPGMKVGGQRQIVLPPNLGYGLYDNGPIPGNSILVFNVTVVSAE